MAYENIAEQTLIEHGMLKHITDGLRTAIRWAPEGGDIGRQLSTVRFIAQSLQRHLDHLLALEEYDGYMDAVITAVPQLSKRVEALRQEHDQFRSLTRRAVHDLEHASPAAPASFTKLCKDLLDLLQKLEEHDHKETALLHEALARDGGGEG